MTDQTTAPSQDQSVTVKIEPKTDQSNAWELNGVDLRKILKGAGLAFGAAALVSIAEWLGHGSIDWSTFLTLCVPAAVSTGINAALKWYQGPGQTA